MNHLHYIDNNQAHDSNQGYSEYNKENINFNIDNNFNIYHYNRVYQGHLQPQYFQSRTIGLQKDNDFNSNKENYLNYKVLDDNYSNFQKFDHHVELNFKNENYNSKENKNYIDKINKKYVENGINVKNFLNLRNTNFIGELEVVNKNQIKNYGLKKDKRLVSNSEIDSLRRNDDDVSVASSVILSGYNTTNPSSSFSNNNKNLFIPLYKRYFNQIPHDYLIEIWETLKSDELINAADYTKIRSQKDINEKMRAILIDWLIDVHSKFNLTTETLFLTVNIIDRYISVKQVLRSKLQLVGVASLFIACKYEEILCPDLKDFVYVTDKTYSKEEILAAEKEILISLNFHITVPTSFRFFEIISLNFNFNELEFTYGKYLLEYFLIDLRLNKYPPSLISLAVAYIIMKMNYYANYHELYSLLNKNHSNSTSKTLKECAKEIFYLVQNSEFLSFKAVLKKYSTTQNHKVAIYGLSNLIHNIESSNTISVDNLSTVNSVYDF